MSSDSDAVFSFIWLGLFATVLVGAAFLTLFLIPVILIGGGIAYAIYNHYHSPQYLEEQSRIHTHELYGRAKAQYGNALDKEEFGKAVYRRMQRLPDELERDLIALILDLYDLENFNTLPPPPAICNTIEGAKYRDFLSAQLAKDTPDAVGIAIDRIVESINGFARYVPDVPQSGIATIPLVEHLENVGEVIESLVLPFYTEDAKRVGLFKTLRQQLDRNLHDVSDVPYSEIDSPKLILPRDYEGENIVSSYLKYTPFEDLFNFPIPFLLPDRTRYEHHWILAGTGHGKTQTLQHMILQDLEKVARDEASVVVIDSQNKLLQTISRLGMFGPGEPLEGKLVWIDPGDVEFPLSINLFDAKLDRINSYSVRDRERLLNNLTDLYEFVFRSLLSSPMTDRQSTLFQFVTRLMLQIPDSNIQTLVRFLGQNNLEGYEEHIAKLDNTAKTFFEVDYKNGAYKDTQQQVRNRLYSILRSATFDRMFSANENRIDLFKELATAKVVLINTDKDLLKEGGSSFFGRFFIALLVQAIEERSQHSNPLPTFLYFDEAEDYFDEQFPKMLSTVRKHNIGMIIAHQFLAQTQSGQLSASLMSNTSIKFVGGVSPQDANVMAPSMETTSDFIRAQPKMAFAAFVKGTTKTAVSLKLPMFTMENMPKLSDEDRDVIRDEMRRKYAIPYVEPVEPVEEPVEEAPEETEEETPVAEVLGEGFVMSEDRPIIDIKGEDITPSDKL